MTPEQIRKLRKRIGLNQRQFARLFEVSHQTVVNWELGRTEPHPVHIEIMKRVQENLQEQQQRKKLKQLIATTGMLGVGILIDWFAGKGE